MTPEVAALIILPGLAWLLYRLRQRDAALEKRVQHYRTDNHHRHAGYIERMVARLQSWERVPGWLSTHSNWRIAAVVFVAVGAIVWFFSRQIWLAPAAAVLAAVAVAWYREAARRKALRIQFLAAFPDAVESLTRSVVAGIPVNTALGDMGQYFPAEMQDRFSKMSDQLELGVPFPSVMEKLSAGTNLPEFEFFCTVLIMNRQTGGRISEVLLRLSGNLREQANARRELLTASAEPRTTAKVVALIPVALIGVQAAVAPDVFQFLLNDPTGRIVLGYAVGSVMFGLWLISRMTRFE